MNVCLFVGSLTPEQHASVSQGRIRTDNCTCCHTEMEVADQTFYLTQSQYTDTGPTSPSADPITSGAWQGSVSVWLAACLSLSLSFSLNLVSTSVCLSVSQSLSSPLPLSLNVVSASLSVCQSKCGQCFSACRSVSLFLSQPHKITSWFIMVKKRKKRSDSLIARLFSDSLVSLFPW